MAEAHALTDDAHCYTATLRTCPALSTRLQLPPEAHGARVELPSHRAQLGGGGGTRIILRHRHLELAIA